MSVIFKRIGVLALALLVFSFPIFSCCFLESAQADVVQKEHSKGMESTLQTKGHSHSESDADTSETEGCDDDQLSSTIPIQSNYLKNFDITGYDFYPNGISYDILGNSALISNRLSALHLPPLIAINQIPIYVKNSTLRI